MVTEWDGLSGLSMRLQIAESSPAVLLLPQIRYCGRVGVPERGAESSHIGESIYERLCVGMEGAKRVVD
jgi:hypothetical protein